MTSTVSTSVLSSSWLNQWSGALDDGIVVKVFLLGALCQEYLGCRKVGDMQIFLWLWLPFSTAFLAFKTFTLQLWERQGLPSLFLVLSAISTLLYWKFHYSCHCISTPLKPIVIYLKTLQSLSLLL